MDPRAAPSVRSPFEARTDLRPRRRLPVTPGGLSDFVAELKWFRPGSLGFPYTAPTWPGTVERPPLESRLGTNYDTEWARRLPARLGRSLVQELLARPAIHALARPRIEGLDRIAHLEEPVIFAANHASHLDAPLLVSVIPDRWRGELFVAGAADYFFDTRLKAATFAFLLNAVPVERQRVSRESASRLESLLEEGWSLLIFPEGGRSPDGWGQPHRAGAAWLAVRTGRPVVPVYLRGTWDILPKGRRVLRPGSTTVTFGRPIWPDPSREGAVGGAPRARSASARSLAEQLERALAALADEQATDWWTARRRAASGTTPGLTGPDASPWRRAWALERRGSRSPGQRRRSAGKGSGPWVSRSS